MWKWCNFRHLANLIRILPNGQSSDFDSRYSFHAQFLMRQLMFDFSSAHFGLGYGVYKMTNSRTTFAWTIDKMLLRCFWAEKHPCTGQAWVMLHDWNELSIYDFKQLCLSFLVFQCSFLCNNNVFQWVKNIVKIKIVKTVVQHCLSYKILLRSGYYAVDQRLSV